MDSYEIREYIVGNNLDVPSNILDDCVQAIEDYHNGDISFEELPELCHLSDSQEVNELFGNLL